MCGKIILKRTGRGTCLQSYKAIKLKRVTELTNKISHNQAYTDIFMALVLVLPQTSIQPYPVG
jgi:hypothetical protein